MGMLEITYYPDKVLWKELLKRPTLDTPDIDRLVEPILELVRQQGDAALIEYTLRFDKVSIPSLLVSTEEIEASDSLVDDILKKALLRASAHIEMFHRQQLMEPIAVKTAPGVTCWQKSVPIEKVGIYIPGGSAPLFSTVLMLVIPARLAGCREIVLCSPPGINGHIHPAILYAAKLTGVTSVFRVGGAQAIAAMAFGTETIPAVYKIFGPGNQYVTAAKQLVTLTGTAIDMPAGPSELAIIADDTANAAFVASDLLSQAEHGPDSQVILFTDSESLAARVSLEVRNQLENLPRKHIAEQAISNSRIFILGNLNEAIDMSNAYAPEHLIVASDQAHELVPFIANAGSVFIGHFAPESAGDYASGTNHTLPTNGYARVTGGVNLDSFMKKITFQEISRKGLEILSPTIQTMATHEELEAHRRSVAIRLGQDQTSK